MQWHLRSKVEDRESRDGPGGVPHGVNALDLVGKRRIFCPELGFTMTARISRACWRIIRFDVNDK